jgi:hypothetical protein
MWAPSSLIKPISLYRRLIRYVIMFSRDRNSSFLPQKGKIIMSMFGDLDQPTAQPEPTKEPRLRFGFNDQQYLEIRREFDIKWEQNKHKYIVPKTETNA